MKGKNENNLATGLCLILQVELLVLDLWCIIHHPLINTSTT